MDNTYLVRAKLEDGWPDEGAHPSKFPITIGPFIVDESPNIALYMLHEGYWEPSVGEKLPKEDRDYPISSLYVDCEIQVPNKEAPFRVAEETISHIESLLRLFQPGSVYLRRHEIWRIKGEERVPHISIKSRELLETRPKPDSAPLYDRPGYDMSDGKLGEFKHFFDKYYPIIQSKQEPLHIATNRFNSSYDKRTLADRFTDLVTAMEALLGDKAKGTSQIAERFACILFPPGLAREEASKQIRRDSGYYDERSRLSHGDKLDTALTEDDVENFEDLVRRLIIKHLEYRGRLESLTSKEDIDQLLWNK